MTSTLASPRAFVFGNGTAGPRSSTSLRRNGADVCVVYSDIGSPDYRVGHEPTQSIAQSAIGRETLISVELRLVECMWWGVL